MAYPSRRARGDGERGAMLVQVAVAMTALCGLSALAVDFGLLMAARSQAQAAADAGALAGATAIGFDDFGGLDYNGRVIQPAQMVARENLVLNEHPSVEEADVSQERRPPVTVYHSRIPNDGVEFHHKVLPGANLRINGGGQEGIAASLDSESFRF